MVWNLNLNCCPWCTLNSDVYWCYCCGILGVSQKIMLVYMSNDRWIWGIKGQLDHYFDVCNNKNDIYVCNNAWAIIFLCQPTPKATIKIKLPKITPRKSIETSLTKLQIFGQHMTLYLLNIVISGLMHNAICGISTTNRKLAIQYFMCSH